MFKAGDKLRCIKGFYDRLTEGNIYIVRCMGSKADSDAHSGELVVCIDGCDQGHDNVRFQLYHFESSPIYDNLPEELFEI